MEYKVLLHQNQEGKYVAIVPALPGCIGQGKTEEEAIANILQEATAWLTKVSLIQRGREGVRHRIETTPLEQMAVTVITVVEQIGGHQLRPRQQKSPRPIVASPVDRGLSFSGPRVHYLALSFPAGLML